MKYASLLAPVVMSALLLTGCSSIGGMSLGGPVGSPSAGSDLSPALDVEVVTDRLEHGWDIGFLPDGTALVTQRAARIALVSGLRSGAQVTEVEADLGDVHVAGEGGLLGLVVHPDFASTRQFTTCQTHADGGRAVDVRLVTWTLAPDGRSATRSHDLLTGLPVADSGRHSGCRPELAADGTLLVGTGDSARGDVPQDRTRLGGKTLRLQLKTGQPMADNPFVDAPDSRERYVYTYGHRNVQGLAVQPGTDEVFAVEHGPDVDDEINVLQAGGNYGWDPSRGGTQDGYDESVPMTDDQQFPDAVRAAWSSGDPTEATSDAAFLEGKEWGDLQGRLAVTALKGSKLLIMTFDDAGEVTDVRVPDALDGTHGRLRAATLGPDGALYVTTSNGSNDELLRITAPAE